ncbi:MAG: hypothetical protein VB122_00370 [Erysipelotrichales bacterium]|nr:hypothetical protein [Erysipelotrichales bacterium]
MKKAVRVFLIIFGIAIISECGLFNFRHWESRFFKYIEPTYVLKLSEGIYNNGDGTFTILPDSEQIITIENINQDVKNIRMNLSVVEPDWINTFSSNILISDEGNEHYYTAGKHLSVNGDARTMVERIHTFGNLNNIKIQLNLDPYTKIVLNDISFNQRVPLSLSLGRFIAVFSILSLFYLFNSKSKIYQTKLPKRLKKIVVWGIILVQITIFTGICGTNPAIMHGQYDHFKEYPKLAVAFTKGNLYLDDEPSKGLMELSNPYDSQLRIEKDVDYLWDYAYFEGKYYVYFGAGPVVLYYLPYYLVTGNELPNYVAIIFSLILFIIFTHLLLLKIAEKYFPKIPFPLPSLLSVVTVFGSGAFYIAHKPDSYSVPIITGLAFMVMGVYFWLDSKEKERIHNGKVILGSFCMAFVLFCRPQLILMAFVAIPLFWQELCTVKTNRKNRLSFTLALLPFLILGLILAYYNYARFGSPFDFGANYNLTTNDMTRRGIEFDRSFDGFFKYLIELPIISNVFPFLHPTIFHSNYIGLTIYESTYGGLFTSNIILLINLFVFKIKNLFRRKELYYTCLVLLISGLVIVFMDIQMAGILQRYFSDFAFFFFLSAVLLLYAIFDKYADKKWITFVYFMVFILGLLSIGYNFLFFLITDQTNISIHNPDLYYNLYSVLQWWR